MIKTQKMSENGEIYTAGKNFTLSQAVTAWTNLTKCLPKLLSLSRIHSYSSLDIIDLGISKNHIFYSITMRH